jgi:TRAP-type C4-dicarboxylate transport system substrate-binding protein
MMNPHPSIRFGRKSYNAASIPLRLILSLLFSLTGFHAVAQTKWLMATEYPASNISGVGLTTFGRLVSSYTDGFVTTTNSLDNELRISSEQMLRATQEHRIAGGDAFAGPMESSDVVFGLASLPFVAQSIDSAISINSAARPFYEAALARRSLKLLYITVWPSTGLWSDRPINDADDLNGLSIRTYDYNSAEVMRTLGATAEYLSFNEAIDRVKSHELNAILTSGDGGAGRKLWDYLRNFTPINYAIPISLAFVRSDEFGALPAAVQVQVLRAAADTEQLQLKLLRTRTEANYAQMRANGVEINGSPNQGLISALRSASKGPVARWKAKAPPALAAIID